MSEIKQQELQELVGKKGGKVLVPFSKPTLPVKIECARGHVFSDLLRNIRAGVWCTECSAEKGEVLLLQKILETEGFNVQVSPSLEGETFSLRIDEHTYIDYDDEEVFKNKSIQEGIIRKINRLLTREGTRIIRVSHNLIMKREDLERYLWESVSGDTRLVIPDVAQYLWLENALEKKAPPPKPIEHETKTVLGPSSAIIEGDDKPLRDLPLGEFAIVGYCRVSTQEQAQQGISLQTQLDKIRQVSQLKGFPLVKVYADKGISGKTIAARPAMMRALEDLKPGYYLAVYSLSRLARNNRQAIEILDRISEKGAYLIALDYDIDTRTPIGQLIYNVLSALSQFETDQLSERVRGNMAYLSRVGKLRSRPAFGWDFAGKGQPFVRNDHEQQIIDYIRKLKQEDQDLTCTSISRILNTRGLRTKRGKSFYQNTVRKIMEDNCIIPRKTLDDRLKVRKTADELH